MKTLTLIEGSKEHIRKESVVRWLLEKFIGFKNTELMWQDISGGARNTSNGM